MLHLILTITRLTEVLDEDGTVVKTYREDGNKTQKILPAFNAWSKSGTVEVQKNPQNYVNAHRFELVKLDF